MHFIHDFVWGQWIFHILISVFGFWRMTRREIEDNPDSTFTSLPVSITPAGLQLDPDAPTDLELTKSSE